MSRHALLMVIGCILPLIVIFLLPMIGITGNVTVLIFIVLMLLCHLMMPMHGGHGRHESSRDNDEVR